MPLIGDRTRTTIETILLATDFSKVSQMALRYAKTFGRHFQSSVKAVHVVGLAAIGAFPEGDGGRILKIARQEGESGLLQVNHELRQAGLDATSVLVEAANPGKGILQIARDIKPDLIVMGTAAAEKLDRFSLGSTAEQVIRHADCPVLTIGPHVTEPKPGDLAFRKVLYATDFSPEAAPAALYALSLAR